MSAKEQLAAMLDELMGPRRNDAQGGAGLDFRDDNVCKFSLVAFCPHEMFVNTKADLGPCGRIHDEGLKKQYRDSDKYEKLGYERSFYNFISRLHDDMKRKIVRNKERLALTQGPAVPVDDETKSRINANIAELDVKITEYMREAERNGVQGEILKSQEYVKEADKLKLEREQLKKSLFGAPTVPIDPNAKPMEVCETCGCFLIIGDVQQRIDEHYTGKQHMGFAKIAVQLQEMDKRFREIEDDDRRKAEQRRKEYEKERNGRDRSRERQSNNKSHSRDRSREKKHDKEHKSNRHRDDDRRHSHGDTKYRHRSRSPRSKHRHY